LSYFYCIVRVRFIPEKELFMRKYRLCGIQIETGNNPHANLEKVTSIFREAVREKPDFIVFPEMYEVACAPEKAAAFAHQIPSDFTEKVRRLARTYSVNIIGGSIFEKEGDVVYNTAVVYNRNGEICGKYRKMHLFDAFNYGESKGIQYGNEPLLVVLDDLTFGIAICYDIRFPEIFRYYALHGAQVVFLPAAFFQPNHDHWQINIRSRALDNTMFVMSCNQTGKRFVGRSMTADPWGVSISSLGMEEGYYIADIDVDRIQEVRERLPFLENRRFDVLPRDGGIPGR
jgi:predicted amidohydrolase